MSFERDFLKMDSSIDMEQVELNTVELVAKSSMMFKERVMLAYFLYCGNVNVIATQLQAHPNEIRKIVEEATADDEQMRFYRKLAEKSIMEKQFQCVCGLMEMQTRKIIKMAKNDSALDSIRLIDIASALKTNYQIYDFMNKFPVETVDTQKVEVKDVKKLEDFN